MADKDVKSFFGGWFSDRSKALTADEDFDVYQTKSKDYRNVEEFKFYDDRLVEYQENEWFSFLVDYLVGELFTDFYFVGDGADDVRSFFRTVDPLAYDEIELMGLNVVREGTGALKKYWVDGELRQIKAMNGRLIRLKDIDAPTAVRGKASASQPSSLSVNEREDTRFVEVTVESDDRFLVRIPTWRIDNMEDYRNEQIALCRVRRDPRSPYGIAFGRSCFHIIKAMKMVDRDILASLKQNAANLKVIRADLSGLDTDDDKKAALDNLSKAYGKIATATTGVIAIDAHHEVGYMGNLGSGSRDSRLLEVMSHLEPVISALLMNFLISVGIIEQTGANKSIIARQEIRAERQLARYQRAVGRFFETQIFPDITDAECRLVFKKYYDPEIWLKLFEKNAISREKLLEEFSVIDDGTTFINDLKPEPAIGPGRPSLSGAGPNAKADSSNDDSSDRRGREEEQ